MNYRIMIYKYFKNINSLGRYMATVYSLIISYCFFSGYLSIYPQHLINASLGKILLFCIFFTTAGFLTALPFWLPFMMSKRFAIVLFINWACIVVLIAQALLGNVVFLMIGSILNIFMFIFIESITLIGCWLIFKKIRGLE